MSDGTFHFKTIPLAIRGAQILGITSAAALTGYIASFSIVLVPALDTDPPASTGVVAKQWAKAYQIGAGTAPYFAIISSLSFGFLATQAARLPKSWYGTSLDPRPAFNLYSAAAVLVPAIVPFTLIVMKETNARLHQKAKTSSVEAKEDVELVTLLSKWQLLNSARAVLPGIAAVLGLWAAVARPEFIGLSIPK